MKSSLAQWQTLLKDTSRFIVQASSIPHDGKCDEWQPFPIGMGIHWLKHKTYQLGTHENLVLCAVNEGTDMGRRKKDTINRFKIVRNLARKNILNCQIPPEKYFKELPSYKFVISPEGNGIDCHRHYEALMAGCIPIIEDNPLIREKYKGCPILYTKDYSEITKGYLERKYKEMVHQEFSWDCLFKDYYSEEQQKEIERCSEFWIQKLSN